MSLEEVVKQNILEQYKSVRAFTQAIGVPYSTIDSMLKKGIRGTSVHTVIRVCDALGIDIDWIAKGILSSDDNRSVMDKDNIMLQSDERQLILNYRQLSDEGKESIQKQMILHMNTYKKSVSDTDMEASEELA